MSNITEKFRGIPMQSLIGEPLRAASDAQIQLAKSAYEFITQIGFENGDFSKPNLIKFDLERPVETPNGIEKSKVEIQAPFLGLVPLPNLLVDDVNINFQMDVNTVDKVTEQHNRSVNTNTSGGFRGIFARANVQIQGQVSSSRENTRSTNQTAKYQVNVSARQQPPTEGLSKLMDLLASSTAPLRITQDR